MPDDDATTTHAREPLARCWAVFDRADHWQQFRSGASTQNLRYEFWPVYWAACVGLGLLAVELLFSGLRQVRKIVDPTGVEEDVYGETRSTPMI